IIEFQKIGLPQAYIILFLHPEDKYQTHFDIDTIISAELPDQEKDPFAYETVVQFMIHGPFGSLNPNAPSMVNGKCSKHFPKKQKNYIEPTVIPEGQGRLERNS
ncbi:hypothetical protein CFOL_v3_05189, partial [Cephalotus follicularis]